MAYLALVVEDVVINKWEINQDELIIGRVKFCDIQIDDKSVSSKHARLVTEGDNLLEGSQVTYLEDLFSTNGTELNGKPVTRALLENGDTIKIGFNQFRYVSGSALGLDETAVIVG
jgi:pSer/pThr/pTyr-binding forkhead associated (FHA) protein